MTLQGNCCALLAHRDADARAIPRLQLQPYLEPEDITKTLHDGAGRADEAELPLPPL